MTPPTPEINWQDYKKLAFSLANRIYYRQPPGWGGELEDLVQTALFALWSAARSWSGIGAFPAYAATAICNAVQRETWRSSPWGYAANRNAAKHGKDLLAWRHSPPDVVDSDLPADPLAARDLVEVLLACVPTQQRWICQAKYLEDRSDSEIAKQMNVPRGTVWCATQSALTRMRRRAADMGLLED